MEVKAFVIFGIALLCPVSTMTNRFSRIKTLSVRNVSPRIICTVVKHVYDSLSCMGTHSLNSSIFIPYETSVSIGFFIAS